MNNPVCPLEPSAVPHGAPRPVGPSLPRRRLASLAALLGAGALASCAPRTNPEVPKDPLSELPASLWNGTTLEDLLAAPMSEEHMDKAQWEAREVTPAHAEAAREEFARYLEAAYLKPQEMQGKSSEQQLAYLLKFTPEGWKSELESAFKNQEQAPFAAILAPPLQYIGTPRLAIDWYLTEGKIAVPQLVGGGTVAWSVVNPETNHVGVYAVQFAMNTGIYNSGIVPFQTFATVIAGVDLCATKEAGGATVPLMQPEGQHKTLRTHTLEMIVKNPQIPLEDLMNPYSDRFDGRTAPVVNDCR